MYILVNDEFYVLARKYQDFDLRNEKGFKTRIYKQCLTRDLKYFKMFKTKLGAMLYNAYIADCSLGRLHIISYIDYVTYCDEYGISYFCSPEVELVSVDFQLPSGYYSSKENEKLKTEKARLEIQLKDAEEHIDNLELKLREQYQINKECNQVKNYWKRKAIKAFKFINTSRTSNMGEIK